MKISTSLYFYQYLLILLFRGIINNPLQTLLLVVWRSGSALSKSSKLTFSGPG